MTYVGILTVHHLLIVQYLRTVIDAVEDHELTALIHLDELTTEHAATENDTVIALPLRYEFTQVHEVFNHQHTLQVRLASNTLRSEYHADQARPRSTWLR